MLNIRNQQRLALIMITFRDRAPYSRGTVTKSVHTNHYARFLRLLVAARKDAGITQDEVALRLNRPQSFVSKYENGERHFDVIDFLDIADAIGFNAVGFIKKILTNR